MPEYPNPAGGSMTAANDADAKSKGWTPAMGTFGVNTYPNGGGGSSGGGGGGGGGVAQTTVPNQLGTGVQRMLGALSSGDIVAFNEEIRQFNAAFGLDEKKFGEAVRQFNQNYLISESGLTGTYGGQQTQQAQLQAANLAAQRAGLTGYYQSPTGLTPGSYYHDPRDNATYVVGMNGALGLADAVPPGAPMQTLGPGDAAWLNQMASSRGQFTQQAQQQQYEQQMGMIKQAADLQANPFRQQQALGQMNRLLGGQGVAGFTAPNQVAGVGVAGGNTGGGMGYLSQMIDDIRDPSANTASMNQIMQGIPTPNKLNSNEFLRAAPSTQSMVLQGMQEKYGLDPNDALAQIKSTLPQFNAPTTFGGVKR